MKIKNIQDYRSFYKSTRPVSQDCEEHFIGNYRLDEVSNQKRHGWFAIYHGDKDGYASPEAGIENFLQSFLDMAKDGQAVYEFLQNAVDAGSTHFAMVWGKDKVDGNHYLLVANNGNMFDLDSIRSILNVGNSTKSNDSYSIGKFGIGFKLAHRLVGKDNGLQELISEHSGPILFSWKNDELAQLAQAEQIEPIASRYAKSSQGNHDVDDDHPWLFKILITCFPCLPENDTVAELPVMVNGQVALTPPFSKTEYEVLARWVNDNRDILNKDTYREGSLFFIKLGTGKEEELAELNLKEGVKFAIAILKETADASERAKKLLHTVQLNDGEAITYPELEYIKIQLDKEKEKDTYANIRFGADKYEGLNNEQKRKVDREANIEALFGFKKFQDTGSFFKGAPNFYLYFPLSEEVHNFNYILHSNAFYKGSSRTFLHKGNTKEDGINERLLKVIGQKIREKLQQLSTSANPADRELFLHFYAALLTSGQSDNQVRQWIEKPYIEPVNILLKDFIPVCTGYNANAFNTASDFREVFIKKTAIPVDPHTWNLARVHWFYWEADQQALVAAAMAKLQIEGYSIFNLLQKEGIDVPVNAWLNGEEEKIKIVLNELSAQVIDKKLVDKIKPQLLRLELFRFSNGELLPLSAFLEKEQQGYFLLHNTLGEVKELLQKAGLITTVLDLNESRFIDYFRTHLLQTSKHGGYTSLTQLFSLAVKDEKLSQLSRSEKLQLFNAFRTLSSDNVTERIKELTLFNNNLGKPTPFKALLSGQSGGWLNQFSIAAGEYDDQVKSFLLDEPKDFYQLVIYPFWQDVLQYLSRNSVKVTEVVTGLQKMFNDSRWPAKQQHLLSNQHLVLYKGEVIATKRLFFHPALVALYGEVYRRLQDLCLAVYAIHLPDQFLVDQLEMTPLVYAAVTIAPAIANTTANLSQLNDLMLFTSLCHIDFFGHNCIHYKDGQYHIDSQAGWQQISHVKANVVKYIHQYYPGQYTMLPVEVEVPEGKIKLSGPALVHHLIESFVENDLTQEYDLIEVVLSESYDHKKQLLDALTHLPLDMKWEEERANRLYLKLLNDVMEEALDDVKLAIMQRKVKVGLEDDAFCIGDIDSAQDTIAVMREDKTIHLSQSQILNLEGAGNIRVVQALHDDAVKRELIQAGKAHRLFKISTAGVTEELKGRFLEKLENKQLENSHQLLFVLLSGLFTKDDFSSFSVMSADENWYDLAGNLLCGTGNAPFVQPLYIAHEKYSHLQELLQLGDNDIFNYGKDEGDLIAPRFLFVKGLGPDVLTCEAAITEKLDYLYRGWKSLSSAIRVAKRHAEWNTFLGIHPAHYVLEGICTEDELLPEDFSTWCLQDAGRQKLLQAVGVHGGNSHIQSLRLFLLTQAATYADDIDVLKLHPILLLHTLQGLAGDFSILQGKAVVYELTAHAPQLLLIEQIIHHLTDRDMQCPLLIYNDRDQFELVKTEGVVVLRLDSDMHGKLAITPGNNLSKAYTTLYIVKDSLLVKKSIQNRTETLPFISTFIPSEDAVEHNEPFYNTWRKKNDIILLKQAAIVDRITLKEENDSLFLGNIKHRKYEAYENEEGATVIHYVKSLPWEELKEYIAEEYPALANLVGDLLTKRDAMLASVYNAYNAAGKDDVSAEHLQALHAIFKEEDARQERQTYIQTIKDSSRYSYDWFLAYLDYLLTFSANQADNSKPKIIRFQSISRQVVNDQPSSKYFLLRGPSSYVSEWIEEISDFTLVITWRNGGRMELLVEGAQKRGQDLVIYCPAGNRDLANNLDQVFQAEITFVAKIDLLQELRNAFANQRYMNVWDDVQAVLPDLHFVFGPPGTGKTTILCKRILETISSKPTSKILFLTPTNKAADVLCKKILLCNRDGSDSIGAQMNRLEQEGNLLNIFRIGKATDPDLEALGQEIYQDSLNQDLLSVANVVAMTIHRLPYMNVFDVYDDEEQEIKLFRLKSYWDFVIIDEASMINLPYLVFALMAVVERSPAVKIIIAGDPKQIPPVVDVNDQDLEELDIKQENVYTMLNIKSFNKGRQQLRTNDTIEYLTVQYRSVSKIGQLFSEFAYENLLSHHRQQGGDQARPMPGSCQKLINDNVLFIDIPLNKEDSVFKIRKLFYSPYHLYSAILVAELIRYFDAQLPEKDSWTIGLIAPYKAQAILLDKLVLTLGVSDKVKLYADTVHGFQGDECDMIFFIVNPNNDSYTGHPKSLLSKEYIYNVAISRARDYLVVLHPFMAITNNDYVNRLVNIFSSNFGSPVVKPASEIEQVLFGRSTFIEDSSYITGHDTVNVFGQPDMKYFIKANSNAIDIQLRNFGKQVEL